MSAANATAVRESLERSKRGGISWDEAWDRTGVRVSGLADANSNSFNQFLHRIMKQAYNNDDRHINWGALGQMELGPLDSLKGYGGSAGSHRQIG